METTTDVSRLIQEIVEALRTQYAPEKVILFGSHAEGTARPGSDIDLLIIRDTDERFIDRCFTVRRILTDPKRTTPLEVLVLTPCEVCERLEGGDQFVADVLHKGKVVYEAD